MAGRWMEKGALKKSSSFFKSLAVHGQIGHVASETLLSRLARLSTTLGLCHELAQPGFCAQGAKILQVKEA